ncbi:MAG: hypothetical protein ACTHU0_21755 [Kofleriaceae bacterium]
MSGAAAEEKKVFQGLKEIAAYLGKSQRWLQRMIATPPADLPRVPVRHNVTGYYATRVDLDYWISSTDQPAHERVELLRLRRVVAGMGTVVHAELVSPAPAVTRQATALLSMHDGG